MNGRSSGIFVSLNTSGGFDVVVSRSCAPRWQRPRYLEVVGFPPSKPLSIDGKAGGWMAGSGCTGDGVGGGPGVDGVGADGAGCGGVGCSVIVMPRTVS